MKAKKLTSESCTKCGSKNVKFLEVKKGIPIHECYDCGKTFSVKKTNPMIAVVNSYVRRDGSLISAAIRDILTDLIHLCEEYDIDFDTRVVSAKEVADQE